MLPINSGTRIFIVSLFMLMYCESDATPGILIRDTYVLAPDQYPQEIKKQHPGTVYIIYSGPLIKENWRTHFFRNDTIIQLKRLMDSAGKSVKAYRLLFGKGADIDSVWQMDAQFHLTDKAWNRGAGILEVSVIDEEGAVTDRFFFNYRDKYIADGKNVPSLRTLLRKEEVYSSSDRSRFSAAAVWVLSVGINIYNGEAIPHYKNCETDALAYNAFFKKQFQRKFPLSTAEELYHGYVLTGAKATRNAILETLREITTNSSPGDYFIFNFSGFSFPLVTGTEKEATCFFPWSEKGYEKNSISSRGLSDSLINGQLITLKVLQEYFQLIPARNQLLLTESGPTKNFKTEFVRTLMQNSPIVSGLLNKNRVIIVPEGIGMDNLYCNGKSMDKGPLNYYLTSLDSTLNIYDLFQSNSAEGIVYKMKQQEAVCNSTGRPYFDIFFEQPFLRQYREIFGDDDNITRGLKVKSEEITKELSGSGKHYALVIGTDHYKSSGWKTLSNPVADARAVAAELKEGYGFDVQLLEDQSMDSIYSAIRYYYNNTKPDDQLVIYFAGHGDMDEELLDDGFIVCSDSRSVTEDPVRNTYIPYLKLKKMINNIPARQILVLLDVCHGGVFNQKVFDQKETTEEKREGVFGAVNNRNVVRLLKEKLPLRTRKFLSSVGTASAFDGKAGRHSPFANLLLQVLRSRGAGSNGILTLTDIYTVLQSASLNETTNLRISPAMDNFGRFDPFSEFIFIPVAEIANGR